MTETFLGLGLIALALSVIFSIVFTLLRIPYIHPYTTVTYGLQLAALIFCLIGYLVS